MLNNEVIEIPVDRSDCPLRLVWPIPGDPAAILEFPTLDKWRAFMLSMNLHSQINRPARDKYERAQNFYYMGWVYYDFIKGGELAALVVLEVALIDCYSFKLRTPKMERPPPLHRLLRYMVEDDGLTDDQIPLVRRRGGSVIANLYEPEADRKARCAKSPQPEPPMTLVQRRNKAAHGDPFDTSPSAGLLEVVRDLIEYAYRNIVGGPR
jgi:hypothetical protein